MQLLLQIGVEHASGMQGTKQDMDRSRFARDFDCSGHCITLAAHIRKCFRPHGRGGGKRGLISTYIAGSSGRSSDLVFMREKRGFGCEVLCYSGKFRVFRGEALVHFGPLNLWKDSNPSSVQVLDLVLSLVANEIIALRSRWWIVIGTPQTQGELGWKNISQVSMPIAARNAKRTEAV